jgi:hypothetical protein
MSGTLLQDQKDSTAPTPGLSIESAVLCDKAWCKVRAAVESVMDSVAAPL